MEARSLFADTLYYGVQKVLACLLLKLQDTHTRKTMCEVQKMAKHAALSDTKNIP